MAIDSGESHSDREQWARKKVKRIKGFFNHLTIFMVINMVLAYANYRDNEWQYIWFLWTTVTWGLAILIHAINAFGVLPFMGEDWKKRKIKALMEKDAQQQDKWK